MMDRVVSDHPGQNANLPLPEGYKMTELGPMPAHWQVVRLGEVAASRTRNILPNDSPSAKYVGLEHLDSGEIFIRRHGFASETRSAKSIFNFGDILYGKLRPYLDKVAIAEWEGVCSTDILVLVCEPNKVDIHFFAYMMHSYYVLSYAIATTTGVNHPRTSWKALSNAVIPLPPLAEQRAIACVLQTVQRAREATEGVIAALKDLKKSLMRHLFTYGPVPVTERDRVELQETELGPLPAHWQVVRLGEVAEIRAGVAFPHEYQGSVLGDYPFYKVSDMNLFGNEIYMEKAINWVNSESLKKLKAKLYPPNTVIFPKVGGALLTNKKRLLSRESLIDNNIMGVIVRQGACLPHFCFYWFEAIDIRMFSNPGPLPSINAEIVKKSLIPLPPLAEQQEIARILRTVDAKIQAEEARRAALQHLFQSMLRHLMTASVRLPPEFIAQFEE